jgi:hypothetical protein
VGISLVDINLAGINLVDNNLVGINFENLDHID